VVLILLMGAALLLAVAAVRGGSQDRGGPVPQGASGPVPSAPPAAGPIP
jgi:hypothetical protein